MGYNTNIFSASGLAFLAAIEAFDFDHFDDIMGVVHGPLDLIQMKEGYVVDAFSCGDRHGSHLKLYPERIDANIKYDPKIVEKLWIIKEKGPFGIPIKKAIGTIPTARVKFKDGMFIDSLLPYAVGKEIPNVFDYLTVPYTEEGIWQAALLYLGPHVFPRVWHDGYGHYDFVFDLNVLRDVLWIDQSFYLDESLLPTVKLVGDQRAEVTVSFITMINGLCRKTLFVDKNLHFIEGENIIIQKHDDGIRF